LMVGCVGWWLKKFGHHPKHPHCLMVSECFWSLNKGGVSYVEGFLETYHTYHMPLLSFCRHKKGWSTKKLANARLATKSCQPCDDKKNSVIGGLVIKIHFQSPFVTKVAQVSKKIYSMSFFMDVMDTLGWMLRWSLM
jgi:hypothetical protein